MKKNVYILTTFILLGVWLATPAMAADTAQDREWKIKAAFLYNFLNFVDLSQEKWPENDESIIIGVIGNNDFIKILEPINKKQLKGKKFTVKYFKDLSELKNPEGTNNIRKTQAIESLKQCYILFFCSFDSAPITDSAAILKALKGSGVLTVGEQAGFLEDGGVINFIEQKKKVRFEINLAAANENQIRIRSKLLTLAKRLIGEKHSGKKDR